MSQFYEYKQGISRQQVSLMSIACHISSDNPVLVIDMFVEQLDYWYSLLTVIPKPTLP
jgi:hypothetical protein